MNSPKSNVPDKSEQPSSSAAVAENTKNDVESGMSSEKWDEEHAVSNESERRRRRSQRAATGESTFNESGHNQNAVEEETAAGGAEQLRNDEVGKSGRSLGERNREAKSVRTRNFASSRTDRDC